MSSSSSKTERQTIQLEGGKPWGFRIVGGTDMVMPLQVQQVLSAKAKGYGLLKDDKIVEINGQATLSLPHNEAKNIISASGNTLILVIERDSSKSPPTEERYERAMLSTPSNSTATPPTEMKEPSKKVEIKPKVYAVDESVAKLHQGRKVEEKTPQQIAEEKMAFDKDVGHIDSSEVRSPFLKNLIATGGGDRPSEPSSYVTVKPPTATYTPTKNPDSDSEESRSQSSTKANNNSSSSSKMEQSLEKVCAKCKAIIKDSGYISASDKYYHKPHFSCTHCNAVLVGKAYFEDKEKNICCQQCVSKGGSNKCKICGKPIHGSFLTVGDECYHDDCFTCSNCKKSLKNEPFILSDGKPQCEHCYENLSSTYCIKCKKPIKAGESFVEVENGHCHSKCFTCKICKSVLTSFKMRDGYAICPKH